jgi:alpha-2-macroglobulin
MFKLSPILLFSLIHQFSLKFAHYRVLIGISLWGFFLLVACSSPEIIRVDPVYAKYISGYSAGMISKNASIRVQLQPDLMRYVDTTDRDLIQELFTIEPKVKGRAVFLNEFTVEFIPDAPLPVNQLYNVFFDLKKVSKVDKGHESFRFQVATLPQQIEADIYTSYYSDNDAGFNKDIEGYIQTSEAEDTATLRKLLTVKQDGRKLSLVWDYLSYDNKWLFRVEGVKQYDYKSEVVLSWDGKAISSFSKGQKSLIIPEKGEFFMILAKADQEEEQFVDVNFSNSVSTSQLLDGLIEIKGVKSTYSVMGSTVRLYPQKRLEGSYVLQVSPGVLNSKGEKLKKAQEASIRFEGPKPGLRIKGNGNILPQSQGLIFPFEAQMLKSVEVRVVRVFEQNVHYFLQTNDLDGDNELSRFGKVLVTKRVFLDKQPQFQPKEWTHYVLDLQKFIRPEPGAIYRVSLTFTKRDAACDCTLTEEEPEKTNSWSEQDWNRYGFDDRFDGWYSHYNLHRDICDDEFYYGKAISKNILASDLGIVFKLDEDKKGHVFVSNMLTAQPVPNAKIEFFTYAKELIVSGQTDANGMMDVVLKQKPFLLVAKKVEQRGYLKLLDGKVNSLSRFEVEGVQNPDGISGLIYGERGVWRPGDSLYLTFMLGDRYHQLPKNYPVEFSLTDPNGQEVYLTTKTKNENGLYDFRTVTDREAPTGNYLATARVGNESFFAQLKVEAIKPNRLKIHFKQQENQHLLSAHWLHGAPAKHLKALVTVSMQAEPKPFPNYKGFIFHSPIRSVMSDVMNAFDEKMKDDGPTIIQTLVPNKEEAPGLLKANYVVKVFEQSGDFSIDRFSSTFSPFSTYVGLKVPHTKAYDETLETGKNHRFEVATVNEKGQPVDCERLQVRIYQLKWRWWYEQEQDDELYHFVARNSQVAVKDTVIQTKGGKGAFSFRLNYPQYGRYLVTVTDPKGKHQAGQIIQIDWPYWERGGRSENEEAKMMHFSLDKKSYTLGESVVVRFPSPAAGRALISVENNKRVIEKFWIPTQAGETTCSFKSTAAMSPGAYVHITLIQPHGQTKNDLPIRMYGVVPLRVDDPKTHLQPLITSADVFKPESKASVRVKEKNGRKMTYTIALVDDGLLDLTRFKTPEPWTSFYPKEALGVMTWDMYDDVIGAFAGKLNNLLGVGGDGEEEELAGPKANRFKPFVRFLGSFTLEAGQEKNHQFDIPNYVGSGRIMVVAHDNNGAYGQAEKSVFIRKPLMLLTTLPRVLGPDEEITIPVTVFAMESHVKTVVVSIEGNDLLTVQGNATQTLYFSEIGEKMAYFKLKTPKKIGLGKLKLKAISGGEMASEILEIDVRPSSPMLIESENHTLEPGGFLRLPFELLGMGGTNQVTVEVSTLPAINLEKRLNYLVKYPHGCLEQTTSGAFPQLFLANLMELTPAQKKTVEHNVQSAIDRLQRFQTMNGGFAYWPGEQEENEWGSTYAGHFLIEAKQIGFKVSEEVLSKWIGFQQQKAKNWSLGAFYGRQESDILNQSYRLFTLSLIGKTELGAMNRLRENPNLSGVAALQLAAAYSIFGQKEPARLLLQKAQSTSDKSYRELSGTFGSGLRDDAMKLQAFILLNNQSAADNLVRKIALQLRSDVWLSTQETAMALLGLSKIKNMGQTGAYSIHLEKENWQSHSLNQQLSLHPFSGKALSQNKAVEIKNKGNLKLYITMHVSGTPLISSKKIKNKGLQMEVSYSDTRGKLIQPDELVNGTEFLVKVKITNTDASRSYKELALSHIVPSGWEIINSRMDGQEHALGVRYQDQRDDRIYSYFDLASSNSKTVQIRCVAAYTGTFYMPTILCTAMYDERISGSVDGRKVSVVQRSTP